MCSFIYYVYYKLQMYAYQIKILLYKHLIEVFKTIY